ncbi:MAG: hypothetical protein AAGE96_05290 [Cyanobacteria bacterium P01_G01_bin.19]
MIAPEKVTQTALTLVDTPFQHQGRKPGLGLDCIGVPIVVAQQLGLGDFDEVEYSRNPDGQLKQKIETVCEPIFLQPGALLIFKISVEAQHCGIFTGIGSGADGLVHAWDIADKVVHQRLGDWRRKIVGCYGLPGVDYV